MAMTNQVLHWRLLRSVCSLDILRQPHLLDLQASSGVAPGFRVEGSKIWPGPPPRDMATLEQTCCMKVRGQPTLGPGVEPAY